MKACTPLCRLCGRLDDRISEPTRAVGPTVTAGTVTLIGLPRMARYATPQSADGCTLCGYVGENGTPSVTGHILSAGLSRQLFSLGVMLQFKICLFSFAMVRYYQNNSTPVTRVR